jgi:hypothetical protein
MEDTPFERTVGNALEGRPLVRAIVLIAFLVFGFGLPMGALLGWRWAWGIGAGVLFAVLWLVPMELYARSRDDSMFRYFLGGARGE